MYLLEFDELIKLRMNLFPRTNRNINKSVCLIGDYVRLAKTVIKCARIFITPNEYTIYK